MTIMIMLTAIIKIKTDIKLTLKILIMMLMTPLTTTTK